MDGSTGLGLRTPETDGDRVRRETADAWEADVLPQSRDSDAKEDRLLDPAGRLNKDPDPHLLSKKRAEQDQVSRRQEGRPPCPWTDKPAGRAGLASRDPENRSSTWF